MLSQLFLPFFLAVTVLQCGVNAGKIRLEALPIVATFYPETAFTGYPFTVRGIYDTCYNFKGYVSSIILGPDTDECELWSVERCGDKNPLAMHNVRIIYRNQPEIKTVDADGDDGTVRSMRCFRSNLGDGELK